MIGVELQGHGRTADIDRISTPAALAGDVVALLDHLGTDRAHVLGFSLGAAVTIELAVSHPDRVRSVVPISEPVRPDGHARRPQRPFQVRHLHPHAHRRRTTPTCS